MSLISQKIMSLTYYLLFIPISVLLLMEEENVKKRTSSVGDLKRATSVENLAVIQIEIQMALVVCRAKDREGRILCFNTCLVAQRTLAYRLQ